MVLFISDNGTSSVNLFGQYQPYQLVWECESGKAPYKPAL